MEGGVVYRQGQRRERMETTSVESDRSTGASGATVMGIIALVASSIGLVSCMVLASSVYASWLPESSWLAIRMEHWWLVLFTAGMSGAPMTLLGTILSVIALFMSRRSGERVRAARLALVVGLVGVAFAVATVIQLVGEA